MLRRVLMAALGLGVGLWSCYIGGRLQVDLPYRVPTDAAIAALPWLPPMLVSASYFAAVFAIPRWWHLADSRRGLRFNPWLAIVPGFWAWFVSVIWHFPQPWGILFTAPVAILVQIASPWEDRTSWRKEVRS